MSGLKELKRRQKTAMVIERMTGAMKMISRARYTAAQNEIRQKGDLIQVLQHVVKRITAQLESEDRTAMSVFTDKGPKHAPWLFVVMTSDSGLCAGFNQKIIKAALQWLDQHKHESVQVLCLGKKGASALQKKADITFFTGFNGLANAVDSSSEPSASRASDHTSGNASGKSVNMHEALSGICDLFKGGNIRGCSMVYGKFFNVLKQEPEIVQILPSLFLESEPDMKTPMAGFHEALLKPEGEANGKDGGSGEADGISHDGVSPDSGQAITQEASYLIIEPNGNRVLDGVLDLWIRAMMKNIAQEHKLSEHAARMNAMDSANSNAKDMIRRLKIQYNRLRQDRITKEIIEIISGSDLSA
jgi:F-type H+-transporting ATPase subunit gamma